MRKPIVAVLEIGTSNTVVLIGEPLAGGRVRVTGRGSVRTAGVRKGLIIDLKQAQAGVHTAVRQAEDAAGITVGEVLLAASGAHIVASQGESQHPILGADGKVTCEDIEEVRALARECRPGPDRAVLHALPQSYRLDDLDGIPNPAGLRGKQLHLGTIFIHGQRNRIDDALNLLKGLALDTRDVAFSALAAATAVLTEEQRTHGVVLVDLGGGTTNYVFINRQVVVSAGSFGVGGDHVTNDIAQAFGIRMNQAEEIKLRDGCAGIDAQRAGRRIDLPAGIVSAPKRQVSFKALHTVIEARMRETLGLVRDQLGDDLRQADAGVVFTGGGAGLPGLTELAVRIFGTSAQIGDQFQDIEGLPRDKLKLAALATVAGLLIRSAQTQNDSLVVPVRNWIGKMKGMFGL